MNRKRSEGSLFDRSRVPLFEKRPPRTPRADPSARTLAASGGAAQRWQRLAAEIPDQEQSNWCWCATSLGVHQYYEAGDSTTQCQAANAILGRTDACTDPGSSDVNTPYFLDRALDHFQNLGNPTIEGALDFADVESEIDAQTPLGARIGWAGGGGHFMVIAGYLADATPMIAIDDPIFGKTDITYSAFCTTYQGNGSWTHSYKTKSHVGP